MSEHENETAAPEAEAPATETTPDPADDFDAARALEKIRKANAEAKSLRERAKNAEDAKTAAELRAATLEADANRVADLEAQLVRERVARRLGLPDPLVDRLKGGTEEEVMADAEQLLALVAKPKVADLKQGTRQAPPTEFNGNDWLRKAAGVAS